MTGVGAAHQPTLIAFPAIVAVPASLQKLTTAAGNVPATTVREAWGCVLSLSLVGVMTYGLSCRAVLGRVCGGRRSLDHSGIRGGCMEMWRCVVSCGGVDGSRMCMWLNPSTPGTQHRELPGPDRRDECANSTGHVRLCACVCVCATAWRRCWKVRPVCSQAVATHLCVRCSHRVALAPPDSKAA